MCDGEELEPGLEGCSEDSGSDFYDFPAPPLPAGLRKTLLTPTSSWCLKRPQKGDEVAVHYVGTRQSDGSTFDSSRDRAELVRFQLGRGEVMRGWELAVATMRLGEVAKFTLSPSFARGGRGLGEGVELPEGSLVFEIELAEWVAHIDLFEDGTVTKRILRRPDDRRRPVLGQECVLNYRLASTVTGEALREQGALEYTIGGATPASASGLICGRVLDRALLSMKRGERASFHCDAGVAFDDEAVPPRSLAPGTAVTCEVELQEFLETLDVSFEKDGTVVKRSLRSREAWTKVQDAGRCVLRVLSVKDGDRILAADQTLDFVVGNGEVCDALECAAPSLRKRELATVTCSVASMCGEPRLGVEGAPGLEFHLEVEDYEAGPAEEARRDEQKLGLLEARKETGVALFKAGRYRLAGHRFGRTHELLGYIDDYRNVRGGEARKARVAALKKDCLLNRALCLVKAGIFRKAVQACDDVLEEETQNPKALFRRAQARLALGDCQDALRDVRRALQAEPQSREARQLLADIRARQREDDGQANTKQLYAKMCGGLGKLPHPLDVD